MVLAIAVCTLLIATAQAEQGAKAMDHEQSIVLDRGPTAEKGTHVLIMQDIAFSQEVFILESRPTATYPGDEKPDVLYGAKSAMASHPAADACNCRVDPRPGW